MPQPLNQTSLTQPEASRMPILEAEKQKRKLACFNVSYVTFWLMSGINQTQNLLMVSQKQDSWPLLLIMQGPMEWNLHPKTKMSRTAQMLDQKTS